jgi:LPXTG-site transpeptidase (sortase) family protein
MRPNGTVYQSSGASNTGEFRVSLTNKEKKHFRFMRLVGTNLSGFALAFAIFVYGPTFELDLNYRAGLARAEQEAPSEAKVVAPIATQKPRSDVFAVSIPSIGATASIIKNVDPYSENEYSEALKKGIAHAAGTGLPGEGKRTYLFAHSTNSPINFTEYNAIFYQLRLLNQGDRIFVNYNGESHLYIVKEKVIVNASDTHWLTEDSGNEQLVLQTCDPPGTTLRRLLIIAEPT